MEIEFRKLKPEEVTFEVQIEPEEDKMVFGSGEPEKDELLKEELQSRLDSGDIWAWCVVRVTAKWKYYSGNDYLGSCSYDGLNEFKKDGYYEDMKERALDDLNKNIQEIGHGLLELMIKS